jgi:site-specific DNA-methyltransferase (adenine-specific)
VVSAEIAKRLSEKSASTPIERTHADMCNRYMISDVFIGLRDIPDRSIDIVEIDPPYAIDLQNTKKHNNTDIALSMQYNEIEQSTYLRFMDTLFKECNRVMSENSWLLCWFAIEPWIEPLHNLLNSNGFKTRRLAGMWYKGDGQLQTIQPGMYLANSYEPFFYAAKGSPSITKQGRSNVFNFKTVAPQRKTHPTERPIELIQEILSTFGWEGARVLVPFLGSGNTILAASNIGMTAFGYDLVQEYKSSFVLKVHDSRPGMYRSLPVQTPMSDTATAAALIKNLLAEKQGG